MLAKVSFNRTRSLVIAAIFTLGSLVAATANAALPPLALTESGIVVGQTANGVNTFLGIPYAAPPVSNLRWRPPQRYGFFPGLVLHASTFGSECTQLPTRTLRIATHLSSSRLGISATQWSRPFAKKPRH